MERQESFHSQGKLAVHGVLPSHHMVLRRNCPDRIVGIAGSYTGRNMGLNSKGGRMGSCLLGAVEGDLVEVDFLGPLLAVGFGQPGLELYDH